MAKILRGERHALPMETASSIWRGFTGRARDGMAIWENTFYGLRWELHRVNLCLGRELIFVGSHSLELRFGGLGWSWELQRIDDQPEMRSHMSLRLNTHSSG